MTNSIIFHNWFGRLKAFGRLLLFCLLSDKRSLMALNGGMNFSGYLTAIFAHPKTVPECENDVIDRFGSNLFHDQIYINHSKIRKSLCDADMGQWVIDVTEWKWRKSGTNE